MFVSVHAFPETKSHISRADLMKLYGADNCLRILRTDVGLKIAQRGAFPGVIRANKDYYVIRFERNRTAVRERNLAERDGGDRLGDSRFS